MYSRDHSGLPCKPLWILLCGRWIPFGGPSLLLWQPEASPDLSPGRPQRLTLALVRSHHWIQLSVSLFFLVSFYLFEKAQLQIEIFHPLSLSSDGLNSQKWARLKPGARCFQILHVGAEAQAPEPSSTAFSGAFSMSWMRSGASGQLTPTHMGCCDGGSWLYPHAKHRPPQFL